MKLFLMMFIVATSVCGFVSCDDDDDKGSPASDKGPSASIVGTWEYREPGLVDTYTFSANGSYTNSWQEGNSKTGSDYGTYTYEGTTLTLNSSEDGVEKYTATISGDKLTLIDEYGYPEVYTRK